MIKQNRIAAVVAKQGFDNVKNLFFKKAKTSIS
jgi:hypothetical protein